MEYAMEQRHLTFLQNLLGPERVSVKPTDLDAHSQDESFHPPHPPEVVVWPESAEEIGAILKYANQERLPVTPWSGGSSLEGNPIPVYGGILLALYNMNKILAINEADLQVVVQPGVVYDELNARLARYGLFFPPAPGSADVATIGGMAANNSSGMHAVRYGATRDYVLALEVVLPDGRILRLGKPVIKSASGYDLVRLFVGSEGTLGVITEITLRLRLVMEKRAAVATFSSMEAAAQTIYDINRYGPMPAALELMDPEIVRLVNQWKTLSLAELPTLVMEFHGTPAGLEEEVAMIEETCRDNGCTSFVLAVSPGERNRLWEGRREAHNAVKHLHPSCTIEIGDIVVPISRYVEAVLKAYELAKELRLSIATFGHAGDGNLHVEYIAEKTDPDEQARARELNRRLVSWVLSIGGTATGEHGIGIGKREFMLQEHGPALAVMRALKQTLDPNGIMNPGKVFP
jgi:D-lactate dehydrogenase (cytochrome)